MKSRHTQQEEFLKIVDQYKKLIFKISNAYCTEPQDRQDLRQEIILQLWKAFPKYDDQYALSTWIYRISLHVSISYRRKENRRKKLKPHPPDPILASREAEQQLEKDENLNRLNRFIAGLKKLDKALMILYLEGKSHAEISEILGLTKSNVGTKINRIKEKLKKHFARKKH